MKGQAFAIAMVVAAGVAMYVMYLSNFESLRETRDALLRAAAIRRRLRLAEAGAAARGRRDRRDSRRLGHRNARGRHRHARHGRSSNEPATARLVSIPPDRRPRVNDLFLRRGRWIERGRPDEVLVSEGFVIAHGLEPGDRVPAVINGRLRRLTIVGVALSPEFVYTIPPGDLVPGRQAVRRLLDGSAGARRGVRHGGRVQRRRARRWRRTRRCEEVISRIDRILEPYGGLGAVPRALQLSHWTVENELSQLQTFGFMLPLIFLMVAAVHPERRADARAGAAASADRGAQGARLRQHARSAGTTSSGRSPSAPAASSSASSAARRSATC